MYWINHQKGIKMNKLKFGLLLGSIAIVTMAGFGMASKSSKAKSKQEDDSPAPGETALQLAIRLASKVVANAVERNEETNPNWDNVDGDEKVRIVTESTRKDLKRFRDVLNEEEQKQFDMTMNLVLASIKDLDK